jgi:positive regulator of sigma E activity
MFQEIMLAIVILIVIWLATILYSLIPGLEAWVIFGSMAGLAMGLARAAQYSRRNP